jgi:hypothetical protein
MERTEQISPVEFADQPPVHAESVTDLSVVQLEVSADDSPSLQTQSEVTDLTNSTQTEATPSTVYKVEAKQPDDIYESVSVKLKKFGGLIVSKFVSKPKYYNVSGKEAFEILFGSEDMVPREPIIQEKIQNVDADSMTPRLSLIQGGKEVVKDLEYRDRKYEDIELSTAEIVSRFEGQHFVKEAPNFDEQADDETRTNEFQYSRVAQAIWNNDPIKATVQTRTEHQGLVELREFLQQYRSQKISAQEGNSRLVGQAKGMLENLTFIGQKEYLEAAKGLSELWKAYLDEDLDNQICVPLKISQGASKRKSDTALFESILLSMSDEELVKYSGRIVTDLEKITVAPNKAKIILLDDWVISGSQMKHAYESISEDEKFAIFGDRVEVNLMVGSILRLENGIQASNKWDGPQPHMLPVVSYYRAHDASQTSIKGHNAHVTGTHSSVDFDFEIVIDRMVNEMNQPEASPITFMPPLTNIRRSYRYSAPLVVISPDGVIKRWEGVK